MHKFTGKVAIVTGAGSGIGYEICRQLAQQGASVALNDVDEELAFQAASKISGETSGSSCVAFAGDASDPEAIATIVEGACDRFGRLDIAIANAGITSASSFLEIKAADLQRMLNLNLQGSVFLAQAAARRMIRQGDGGRVLFMSSVTGHQAHVDLACYGMTKAALQMLAKALVLDLAPHGITCNAISPGAVATERTLAGDPEYASKWAKTTPTGRVSSPSDIAQAALFLVAPDASQITGQTLIVDGGWTCTSPTPVFTIE